MQYESSFTNYLNEYLSNSNNDDECLISGDKLEEGYVTLPCNHKFNYGHIYKEIKNQKEKVNINEIVTLTKNEVKCPYCRSIHKFLLPFNKNYKYSKNIMDKKEKKEKLNVCIAVLKSGPRKGEVCNRKCENNLCYIHRNFIIS